MDKLKNFANDAYGKSNSAVFNGKCGTQKAIMLQKVQIPFSNVVVGGQYFGPLQKQVADGEGGSFLTSVGLFSDCKFKNNQLQFALYYNEYTHVTAMIEEIDYSKQEFLGGVVATVSGRVAISVFNYKFVPITEAADRVRVRDFYNQWEYEGGAAVEFVNGVLMNIFFQGKGSFKLGDQIFFVAIFDHDQLIELQNNNVKKSFKPLTERIDKLIPQFKLILEEGAHPGFVVSGLDSGQINGPLFILTDKRFYIGSCDYGVVSKMECNVFGTKVTVKQRADAIVKTQQSGKLTAICVKTVRYELVVRKLSELGNTFYRGQMFTKEGVFDADFETINNLGLSAQTATFVSSDNQKAALNGKLQHSQFNESVVHFYERDPNVQIEQTKTPIVAQQKVKKETKPKMELKGAKSVVNIKSEPSIVHLEPISQSVAPQPQQCEQSPEIRQSEVQTKKEPQQLVEEDYDDDIVQQPKKAVQLKPIKSSVSTVQQQAPLSSVSKAVLQRQFSASPHVRSPNPLVAQPDCLIPQVVQDTLPSAEVEQYQYPPPPSVAPQQQTPSPDRKLPATETPSPINKKQVQEIQSAKPIPVQVPVQVYIDRPKSISQCAPAISVRPLDEQFSVMSPNQLQQNLLLSIHQTQNSLGQNQEILKYYQQSEQPVQSSLSDHRMQPQYEYPQQYALSENDLQPVLQSTFQLPNRDDPFYRSANETNQILSQNAEVSRIQQQIEFENKHESGDHTVKTKHYVYKGQFYNGKMHGDGVLKTEHWRFEGKMSHNFPDYGTMELKSGDVFSGKFELERKTQSTVSGVGTVLQRDGTIFKGRIDKNKMTGQGSLKFTDGRLLQAYFEDGLPSGNVVLQYPNKNYRKGLMIDGKWQEITEEKKGDIIYKFNKINHHFSGQIIGPTFEYSGQLNGKWQMHGIGTLKDQSGTYIGEFLNNRKNGQFIFINNDDVSYKGMIIDDGFSGEGVINSQQLARWVGGRLVLVK